LGQTSADSIHRFSNKVDKFVVEHPSAADDEFYPAIQENITRASIGDCILRAAGVGELVGKAVGKRSVMKILIKASLKRAVPYLGWGLAIGEGAACLAGY